MKKKLLFISSRPLYPILGGDQIRTVQQLDLLKERFDVDVLYMTSPTDGADLQIYDNGINKSMPIRISKFKHIIQTLRFLFNSLPLQVNYYYSKSVDKEVKSISQNYDAVFCNNIRTAEYAMGLTGVVKYLDFVDAISMNYDKARKEAKGLKKLIYEIDYRRCKKYEQKCMEYFDSCAVISDIDNRYIIKNS